MADVNQYSSAAPRFPNTDKDWPHGYLPDYLRIAEEIGDTAAVCEVGVYNGGSLEMWQELFPRGTIVGVDNNPGCTWPEGTHRIVMAQESPMLYETVSSVSPEYDLIVDDASHIGALTHATFRLLWPLVKPGRYYVVEDWTTAIDLGLWVPSLVGTVVHDGAATVTYTREGLVIVKKAG